MDNFRKGGGNDGGRGGFRGGRGGGGDRGGNRDRGPVTMQALFVVVVVKHVRFHFVLLETSQCIVETASLVELLWVEREEGEMIEKIIEGIIIK